MSQEQIYDTISETYRPNYTLYRPRPNLFLIVGPKDSGKTHLARAIASPHLHEIEGDRLKSDLDSAADKGGILVIRGMNKRHANLRVTVKLFAIADLQTPARGLVITATSHVITDPALLSRFHVVEMVPPTPNNSLRSALRSDLRRLSPPIHER